MTDPDLARQILALRAHVTLLEVQAQAQSPANREWLVPALLEDLHLALDTISALQDRLSAAAPPASDPAGGLHSLAQEVEAVHPADAGEPE